MLVIDVLASKDLAKARFLSTEAGVVFINHFAEIFKYFRDLKELYISHIFLSELTQCLASDREHFVLYPAEPPPKDEVV